MYTSEGQPEGQPEEALPAYSRVDMQPSAPQLQMIVVPEQLNQQPSDSNDILIPSVFFKYCVPLQNGRFRQSYPSLQYMINKEQQEIIERPKRAKCYFVCCTLLLLAGIVGGTVMIILFPDIKWLGYILYGVGGLSGIFSLMNYRKACVQGHVKHAADIYYNRKIVGIFFDIRDNVIKRVGFTGDYGMTKQKENEPLEARCSYLHDPLIRLLSPIQRICKFSSLKNIGWQIKSGGSDRSDTYYLVLQYNTRNGNDYRKYKIDDYNSKGNLLEGYNKLKKVMQNVNPTWFSSGQCVDKGRKTGSWKRRR